MSDPLATLHLGLPYLAAAQAQKHVTHNEALRILDAVIQLAVLDADLTAPPGSPEEGDRHIVADGATGGWADHDGDVAAFVDGAWLFAAPEEGWTAFDRDAGVLLVRRDDAWEPAAGAMGPLDRLGINTTADETNRLAVRSGAVLFSAIEAADGGTGDVRFVVSKEADADTASLLFQSGSSGRAEIGLAGDTDFVVKVSPDGSAWTEAIRIDKDTGLPAILYDNAGSGLAAASVQAAIDELAAEKADSGALAAVASSGAYGDLAGLPAIRERLSANRTYYVRRDGSDANDGLSDTSGGAFATRQKAWDTVCGLDLGIYSVVIQVGDDGGSPYTDVLLLDKAPLGGAGVTLRGNVTTPADCEINTAAGSSGANIFVTAAQPVPITVEGFRLTESAGSLIRADAPCKLLLGKNVYGAAGLAHIRASTPGIYIFVSASYTIDGGAAYHWFAGAPGTYIRCSGFTLTISGTPAFSTAFALATLGGAILAVSNTYSGSATGKRSDATFNGAIQVNGATLPGNAAGTTANGGVTA